MMDNPFAVIDRRINRLESLLVEIRDTLSNPAPIVSAEPFGDFQWLRATCSGIPASTLRIKSANGEIPGVVKFGKRVLYEKTTVLDWLRSQTRQPISDEAIGNQITRQLSKKGGVNA